MNRSSLGIARATRCALLSAVAVTSTVAGAAESKFEPYAESDVQYDSNVFRIDSNANVPIIDGRQQRDTVLLTEIAGANGKYLYSQQAFRGNVEGRRYDFLDIPSLSHYEYSLSGAYDYMLFGRVGGTIDYQEARRQSQFDNRNEGVLATQLNFDKDRSGGISTTFLAANDWRVGGGYHLHELRTPVIGAPGLRLSDETGNAQVDYVGISRFTLGIAGSYIDGNYSGAANATKFNQYSGSFAVSYEASEQTRVSGAIGYTERKDRGLGSTGGITGDLTLTQRFTAKTDGSLGLFRRIMSFAAGDNTVVETGGGLGLNWQTTEKVNVFIRYEFTHIAFQNPGLPGTFDENRADNFSGYLLSVTYRPLTWVELVPSGSYQTRQSSLPNNDFNATVARFHIRATF